MVNQTSQPRSRYHSILIIWIVQVLSLVLLFAITQPVRTIAQLGDSPSVTYLMGVLAIMLLAFSFVVRFAVVSFALARQRPDYLIVGYIPAFVLCEACALLGVLTRFGEHAQYSDGFFVLSLAGFILNFPLKRHFERATVSRDRNFSSVSLP